MSLNEKVGFASPADWRSGGDLFAYGPHRIFFRRDRQADESLVCIHGFPTSSFDFHKVWPRLAGVFPVAAYDLIGYGSSAKPSDLNYTTSLQADVLEGFIQHLGLRRVHILSHDYGNTITLELIARINEGTSETAIASICMLNGALFPETHRPIFAQKLLISPIGGILGPLMPDSLFKKSLAKVFGPRTRPSPQELDDFAAAFNQNNGKRIAHKLIRYMTERVTYRERWLAALRSISVPFRFINGLADPVSGRHLVERFRELVPEQRDVVELEDIGHFPHFEAPEATSEHIVDFFEPIFSPVGR